ncbi:hypothetical protein ACNKHL_08400 [Shigella flexneri]
MAQGLALGAGIVPMIGVSTLMTMARKGRGAKTAQPACCRAVDARMGEVYWAEYQRDENGTVAVKKTKAVLKPELVHERSGQLSGEWVTNADGLASLAESR